MYLPDGSFEIFNAFERMSAAEVEEMEWTRNDKMGLTYFIIFPAIWIELEEALDVGDFDGWAATAKI